VTIRKRRPWRIAFGVLALLTLMTPVPPATNTPQVYAHVFAFVIKLALAVWFLRTGFGF
jgi:hypothetical protein